MYYDINNSLSYNCLFNFIIGNRSAGKTFGFKDWAIRDFLKNGKQFIYVRRYKQEFKKKHTFFNDILFKYPDLKFEVKGYNFLIDGKLAGYGMPLSTAKIEKSTSFPNVNKIGFDEFTIDKGTYRYLSDEVTNFLELYNTVDRYRDETKVFFLSNAITMINPYTLYFNLHMPKGKNIYRHNDILLEFVQDSELIEKAKNTRFGKLIEGTRYASYAIDNNFLRDSEEFITKKTGTAKYYFTFIYKGQYFGVWIDYHCGSLWLSDDIDEFCKIVYSITLDDHTPNTMLLKRLNTSPFFKTLLKNFKSGYLFYENMKLKNIFYDIMRMMLC